MLRYKSSSNKNKTPIGNDEFRAVKAKDWRGVCQDIENRFDIQKWSITIAERMTSREALCNMIVTANLSLSGANLTQCCLQDSPVGVLDVAVQQVG